MEVVAVPVAERAAEPPAEPPAERAAASRLAIYKELSKSGIVALVLISVLGGYLIGQPMELPLRWGRMLVTLVGVLLLASGSSALNQWQESETDSRMPRTARRPIPSGRLSRSEAALFSVAAIIAGLVVLSRISWSVLTLGFAALVLYNGLYTLWWKRKMAYAAVPGAIPGALPILMGYAAASGRVTAPAGIYLFFMLFYWQMPHFWVLALRYREDYAAGEIPTLPVTKGTGVTVFQITLWCLAYLALALVAPLFLRVGTLYTVLATLVCAKLLWELRVFARAPEGKAWLRFFLWVNFSLILFVGVAALDSWSMKLLAPLYVR